MTLSTGTKLAHYEITSQLGKGGMGEVYQAKDQKLGRDVAIKVLPEEFARDTDRVARFQREAKLLASLNHPNIAAIYGLEESEGTHFLVMELIEGDTLADRIKTGPIPVEEALNLALQMAEALEAAHEKGVIHRDLKPANIKVTPEGKVKILDFGLAKAYVGDPDNMTPADSPTLSAAATRQGVILGTAAYMSPEQARGKIVDKRADIWAFGVVLFEMLNGKNMFSGEDVTSTVARVLEREPDFSTLPENLHFRIRLLLERCLEKDPKNRYHDMADARVDIQMVLSDPSGVFARQIADVEPRARFRGMLLWIATAVFLTAIIVGVVVWDLRTPEPREVIRLEHVLPEDQQFDFYNTAGPNLAVSRDGTQLIYITREGLYLRSLDELNATFIRGTDENPRSPFFSPDSQWIGYQSQTDNTLKKISVHGGIPTTLCDVANVDGARWYEDNTIIYSESSRGIMRVSANGGIPEMLVKSPCGVPQLLPDGKSLLFTDYSTMPNGIIVYSLESGKRKEILRGSYARYVSTGHLIYSPGDRNSLFVVPFDLNRLEAKGRGFPIIESYFSAQYTVSDSGTLVYVPGGQSETNERVPIWVDRNGKELPIAAPPDAYSAPRISPDGKRMTLTIGAGEDADIYIWDFANEILNQFTFEKGHDTQAIWSPDGKWIVFVSDRDGEWAVYQKAADGKGDVEKLGSVPGSYIRSLSFSSDGKTLVFEEGEDDRNDIVALSMEGDQATTTLLQGELSLGNPCISPDGKWMAFFSSVSGQLEIFVRPFPNVNSGQWRITINSGQEPRWAPDQQKLFYRSGNAMMSIAIETGDTFNKKGEPQTLFEGPYFGSTGHNWDIHPDGERFLMIKRLGFDASSDTGPRKIVIVTNWFEELKERVPVE
jgi:serine/threonine protein kinase/Tol biopolymer transport system component